MKRSPGEKRIRNILMVTESQSEESDPCWHLSKTLVMPSLCIHIHSLLIEKDVYDRQNISNMFPCVCACLYLEIPSFLVRDFPFLSLILYYIKSFIYFQTFFLSFFSFCHSFLSTTLSKLHIWERVN